MALQLDPKLPLLESREWPRRLTRRLTELFRDWAAKINPWVGPSWEDLRFPAQGINPAGAPTAASFDTTTYYGTLLFSGSAENHIAGIAQLPHSWLEGSNIRPHIHWSKTTADAAASAVDWEFRYAISGIGDVTAAYSSWTAATLVVGDLRTAEKHNISSFGEVPMAGYLGSTIVLWNIRRKGNTDDFSGVCRLHEFDFHYQIGQVGSSNKAEYPSEGDRPLGVAATTVTITLTGGTAVVAQAMLVTGTAGTVQIVGVAGTITASPVTIAATAGTVRLAAGSAQIGDGIVATPSAVSLDGVMALINVEF